MLKCVNAFNLKSEILDLISSHTSKFNFPCSSCLPAGRLNLKSEILLPSQDYLPTVGDPVVGMIQSKSFLTSILHLKLKT
jgi:hypothetical protein